WKADHKAGDLYLGGIHGAKVLVVGKEKCRALNLADGQEAWSLTTGLPSGRGIAANGLYYLPLKSAVATQTPEICTIDIARGRIVAHARSSKLEAGRDNIPGNLVFFEGRLLSQNATQMVGYLELKAKLKLMDESLKTNPRDPGALLDRGELLFDKGDLSK